MWFWLAAPQQPTPTVTTPTVTPTVTRPTFTATVVPTLTFTRPTLTRPIPTATIATIVGPIGAPVGGGPTVIVPRRAGRRPAASRPLGAVKGLSRAQVRKLQDAGIRDAAALAGADPRAVATALALRDRAKADALVEAAKRLSPPP